MVAPFFMCFFKASSDAWYYFGYEDNRLLIQSSNPEFNAIISKKTNASKAKVGDLVFVPGSDEETLTFINRFRQTYYGIEAPYELNGASSSEKKPEEGKKKKKKKDEKDDGF